MPATYVLTTNAGLEELAAAEFLQRAIADSRLSPPIAKSDVELRPDQCFGRVLVRHHAGNNSGTDPVLAEILLSLRSVHDVLQLHTTLALPGAVDPPLALYEQLRVAPLTAAADGSGEGGGPCPPLLGGTRTFRVSCVREGDHSFTSLDIEREVGGALHELYGARASMTQFDVRVRVDVAKQHILIGTALNREPLSRRHKLAFTRSVTLKPNVAYCLLRLAGLCDGAAAAAGSPPPKRAEAVLDPCCGSGTIPLEAAEALGLEAHGVDKSLAVVKGAQANATAAELADTCTFVQGNCRALHTLYPPESGVGRFAAIVTNAPWGVQTAKGGAGASGEPLLEKIYRGLLHSGHAVVRPGGALVMLVLRWSLVIDLARRSGLWRVRELLPIRTSNLTPVAVCLERIDADAPRQQLHARFAELNRYFDFGHGPKLSEDAASASKKEQAEAPAAVGDADGEHPPVEDTSSGGAKEPEPASTSTPTVT